MTRLVASEVLKVITTRLLLWLGLLLLGLELLVIALHVSQDSLASLAEARNQRDIVSIAAVSALIALIVGVVLAAGEFTHGTIAPTFLVAPARERVVAAKLVVGALAGAALAVAAGAFAWGLTALLLSLRSVPLHLGSGAALRVLFGTIAAAAIAGALGVGFGSITHRQTGAIVFAFVWLLVVEPLLAIAGVQRVRARTCDRVGRRGRDAEQRAALVRSRARAVSGVRAGLRRGRHARRQVRRLLTPRAAATEANTCSRPPARLNWLGYGPGRAGRPRRERAQPQGHRRPSAAPCADLRHRPQRLRQVEPRLRHHLRRGPAALRREPLRLRPPVPADDGEAGRRLDRRPLARRSRSTRRPRAATRARPSAPSPRSTTTCASSTRGSASRTARSAAARSPGRARRRSSTRSSSSPRGRSSPSTRRSSATARASTATSSRSSARKGFTRVKVDGEQHLLEEPTDARQEVQAHDRGRRRPPRDEGRPAPAARAVGRDRRGARRRPGRRRRARRRVELTFSENFACPEHGVGLPELEPRIFSFNSPHGACPRCTGLGAQQEIDQAVRERRGGLRPTARAAGADRPSSRGGRRRPRSCA